MTGVIEIRSYQLKPGARDAFASLFFDEVVPLLSRWGEQVVFAGWSLHSETGFVLIRAYGSEDDRSARQEEFYASNDWRNGPRETMLGMIETFISSVLPIQAETLAGWQAALSALSSSTAESQDG